MNVLIISTNRTPFPVPVIPFGACLVAESASKSGHNVSFLDLMFESDPGRSISSVVRKYCPDVIGVSVRNIDNNDMLSPVFYLPDVRSHVRTIRLSTEAPIVLGGAALAVMPEEILRYTGASLAVIGDGEVTFPKLLDRFAERALVNDLAGVASIENGFYMESPPELICSGSCSIPDFRNWIEFPKYRSRFSTVPLQTKLGCQFQCVYCTYRKIEGMTYRLLSPGSAAESAVRVSSQGLRDIEFVDNVFNAPASHAIEVCEALIRAESGARFQSVELNPFDFSDELVSAMERAGFVGIGITAESASDRVLHEMKKGFTARQVQAASDVVRRHRLPCVWIFLLGGPGETEKTVRETLRFAEKTLRPQDVAFFNIGIRVYPGTELEAIARRQGLLTIPPGEMLGPVFYLSPGVSLGKVLFLVKEAMNRNMNFMNGESLNFRYLPIIHRLGYRMGLRPPLWRYTRRIRRGLRMVGMDV